MKIFLDFLPIILFFAAFKFAEGRPQDAAAFATDHFGFMVSGGVVGAGEAPVLLATVVVIAATLLQVLYLKARRQKIDTMLWVSLALVTVLGGATIWFHNETFIKWKPTLLYWALGAGLLVSQGLFRKNPVRALVGANLTLPDPVWSRLNLAWGVFFVALGVLNLWVAYAFSTSTWATFKVFGATGIMLLFMIAQGVYMSRYLPEEEAPAAEKAPEAAAPAAFAAVAEKKHGVTAQDIESALRTALAPAALEVQDDSHLHAGHAGAREGRHFTVRIVSERFAGLNRVARHRLVYDALHELIPRGIHALAIQADTPERSPVHQS